MMSEGVEWEPCHVTRTGEGISSSWFGMVAFFLLAEILGWETSHMLI
jgi:hypothetical protein